MSAPSLPRQLARTRYFSLGAPKEFSISSDGATVLFVRSRAGDDPVSCLWALDVGTGRERLLADPADLLGGSPEQRPEQERIRRERARERTEGIVGYATDAETRIAVFALSGVLWSVDVVGGGVHRLPTSAEVVEPRPDPTGSRIAYVSAGALRVIEATGTGDRTVATPDGAEVTFGLAEHVAAESMHRRQGYWWAPDGSRLLVARVDNTPVQRWYISDPANPGRPPQVIRYPVAGTANAEVSLWVVGLDGVRTEVDWDRRAFEYVTAAGWDAHGPFVAVQSRDQRTVQVLGIDAEDGSTRLLREERDDRWVELVAGVPVRTGSGALVGTGDLAGTRRLIVAGVPVTPEGLQVRQVLGVDGEVVLFIASGVATQIHLWRYQPDEGVRQVSVEAGVHTGAQAGGTIVHVARTLDRFGARATVLLGDKPMTVVQSLAEQPVLDARPTLLSVGPRALNTALFLPSWHRAGSGKLPVLMDPYAGPAMQKVTSAQAVWMLVSQWFAEQGFAVVVADGRGTPGRGPEWEREVYGDKADPVLDDQVEALRETARRYPDLDLSRVAIRGWSFGGYLAALAVLRRPDVFHAAIAGAPVTDQRLYDTHWQERFLGHPDEHPQHYDGGSPITEAARLSRPLLLIHGLADDNVVAAHTLRFSAALLAAGRPHEVLPLSASTHMPSQETVTQNLFGHEMDFLKRSLALS